MSRRLRRANSNHFPDGTNSAVADTVNAIGGACTKNWVTIYDYVPLHMSVSTQGAKHSKCDCGIGNFYKIE